MLENSERSARGVRMGKSGPLERAELANQILIAQSGFSYPRHFQGIKVFRGRKNK